MRRPKLVMAFALMWLAFAAAIAVAGRANSQSEATYLVAPPIPAPTSIRKIDEYGNLRWSDEKFRLNNFAIELRNYPQGTGYIIGYAGRVAREGEARRRIERAKKYLTSVHKLAPERVVTIDGGYREELTVELHINPPGVTPPEAFPTVDPTEVKIIRGKRRPRRHR